MADNPKIEYNIQQTWWHIEDTFNPHPFHHLREIKDIHLRRNIFDNLPEKTIFIDLPPNIFSIKVRCRNPEQELAYTIDNEKNGGISMHIHLPELAQFPIVKDTDGSENYHIKLEIEYALGQDENSIGIQSRKQKLKTEKPLIINKLGHTGYWKLQLKNLIRPKADCSSEIEGWIFPEFNITLPRGWEMETPIKKRASGVFRGSSKNGLSNVNLSITGGSGQTEYLTLTRPDIELINGRRKYIYILSETSQKRYQELRKKNSDNTEAAPLFRLNYSAELSTISTVFSFWIPVIFTLISCGILAAGILDKCNVIVFVSFLVAYLAFLYTYFSYRKDGYDIPSGKIWLLMFVMIVVLSAAAFFMMW